MFKKFELYFLFILFFYYIFIPDYHLYLNIIYILVFIYTIYKICIYIKNNNNNYLDKKYFLISILLFLGSYFLIYDLNPLCYLFTFYLPFEYYFKGILIIIFHSYFLNKFSPPKVSTYNQISVSTDSEIIRLSSTIDITRPSYKNEYFLSNFINYFKKNKKKFICFIISLIFIKIILFFYRTKFWIYFNKKEDILPLSTSRKTKYYITSCVFNMESIIVDYINEMKKVINYLGKENIIISIVENGDSTDKTRDYLIHFQKYLNETNIKNKFFITHEIEDPRKNATNKKDRDYSRIKFITDLRNKCLEFLYQIPNLDFDNTKIIYFNDIVFSYEDVIKLLSTNKEDYDAVCAMDYYFSLYDNWVAIDLEGNSLRSGFPHFINKEAQDQLINKKPIRIFSCWNGLIVFNASAFKNQQIKFRLEKMNSNLTYHINSYKNHDFDYESECTYFHIDLHSKGYTKRFINSDIRVAYINIYYYFAKYILPNTFELIFYFGYYIKSFTKKRNKYMTDLKSKNVKLSPNLENWYFLHKLNYTKN